MTPDAIQKLTRGGLNLIQAALSIFDDGLALVLANSRFQTMFDLPDALVTPGARFEDIIRYLVERGEYGQQDDAAEAVRQRVETARAFQPHYMERQRANGRWISVEGAPMAEGGWITVYTDITEIKIQEQLLRARSAELSDRLLANAERLAAANRELAATNAALAETQRQLTAIEAHTRLVMEMAPAHIAHVNRDLVYTYSNRRLSSVMPGLPRDVVGLHASVALGPVTFGQILPDMQRALGGEAAVCEFTHHDSGRRIRLALTPDPTEGGVYILSTDITAETQARAALMQTRKRALAAQLTSGVAHDFSNLLTVILGLQGRILNQPDLAPDVRSAAQATLAAARRGGDLLNRIAGISGERVLHPAATDLDQLLAGIRAMAEPAMRPGMRLDIRAESLGSVLIDPGVVQDCLLNLILNARDALGNAPGRIAIDLRRVRDTWIEIVVDDTGPGFSAAALNQALDPFFTTKGGEGSGLGLAMVYDQVTLSGGSVRLSNRDEGGARVVLRFPWRPLPQGTASGRAPAHLVLLVEDNPDIRAHVRDLLCAQGHQVVEADNAADARVLAALPQVTLVLSDIQLRGDTDGPALLDLVQVETPGRLMGLMTALPPADARRVDAARRYPVLAKPVDDMALATFVQGLVPLAPATLAPAPLPLTQGGPA